MNLFKNKTTRQKHWIFFSLTALGAIAIVNLSILLMWTDMNEEERQMGGQVFGRIVTYGSLALAIVFLISSQFILYIFKNYIAPIEKLTEETRLITVANAKYRIKPTGAMETTELSEVINLLADSYIDLKKEVKNIVEASQEKLNTNQQNLDSLIQLIGEGIIICNAEGRILKYNTSIQNIIKNNKEIIGIGRSIFGICNREPLVLAFNYLQTHPTKNQFCFITHQVSNQFLKIKVARVQKKIKNMDDDSSYVFIFNDITHKISSNFKKQKLLIELNKSRENNAINLAMFNELTKISLSTISAPNYILAQEFCSIITNNTNLKISIQIESNLWINIENISLLEGIKHLFNYLTNATPIPNLQIQITKKNEFGALQIQWTECKIKKTIIEQWNLQQWFVNHTPDNLIIGNQWSLMDNDSINCIEFKLGVKKYETKLPSISKLGTNKLYFNNYSLDNSNRKKDYNNLNLKDLTFVVFDTETTGMEPSKGDEIVSIAAVRIVNNNIENTETYEQLVNPQRSIPIEALQIHGIYPEMIINQPIIKDVLPKFHAFCNNAVLVAHNAAFDMRFLQLKEQQCNLQFNHPVLDTLLLSLVCNPLQKDHNLESIATTLGIQITNRHSALGDAFATAQILLKIIPLLEAKGIYTLQQAIEVSEKTSHANMQF